MKAPTLHRPPPSLRRRPFQGATPTCSPPTARLSTHPGRWEQNPSGNQRTQPLTSQKDSDTMRGKKRSRNVMNGRMARTSVETAPPSLSLTPAPLCLRLNCMDICTSPKPSMQQEQQPSPQYQSTITSNSLSLLSLSLSHPQTDCSNQGLDQDEVLKRAALLPQVQTDNGGTSAVSSSPHSSACSLHFSVFVHASGSFKGKVFVFTPWMLCTFLSKGEKKCSANTTWVHFSLLGESLCKVEQGIYM